MSVLRFWCIAIVIGGVHSHTLRADAISLLHTFLESDSDGFESRAGLYLDASRLYGTTRYGGANAGPSGSGTVFSLNTDGTDYRLVHGFAGGQFEGSEPMAALVGVDDVLYGTTRHGAPFGHGTVFKVRPDGGDYEVLHFFGSDPANGSQPAARLTPVGSTLVGTTIGGGANSAGTVFRINTDGTGFEILHSFGGAAEESTLPNAAVVSDGTAVYGTTRFGGPVSTGNGAGSVFKVNLDSTGYEVIHGFDFSATDGRQSLGELVLSGQTLYGTASEGGADGVGVVFSVNTDGTNYRVLHHFGNTRGGNYPVAGVILDGDRLYGTTEDAGRRGGGAAFSLKTDGTEFRVLHYFNGADSYGDSPLGRLVKQGSTLYGTTSDAGLLGRGTVFAIHVDDPFAYSYFEEPGTGTAGFTPDGDDDELGFATVSAGVGVNPFVGVTTDGANRVFSHRSVSATTTFAQVALDRIVDVRVSIDLQVSNTVFETEDFVHVYVTNGSDTIDVYNETGAGSDGLDSVADRGFITYSAAIPDDWTNAQLMIATSSNSSQGAERYDFDDVFFKGTFAPVPEPASSALAIGAVIAISLIVRRRAASLTTRRTV